MLTCATSGYIPAVNSLTPPIVLAIAVAAAGCPADGDGSTDAAVGSDSTTTGADANTTSIVDAASESGRAVATGSSTGGEARGSSESSGGSESPEGGGASESSDSTGGEPFVPSLNQGAFNNATGMIEFGYESIATIPITGAPDGIDWTKWAMLFDGIAYRLFFMSERGATELHQFAFNYGTESYEYGFNSAPVIPISGVPDDADPSRIAMLHDGVGSRLFFLSDDAPLGLHQFAFNSATEEFEYGFNLSPEVKIVGGPAADDFSGWAMLHGTGDYRMFAFSSPAKDAISQYVWNGTDYEYGFNSNPEIGLDGFPADSDPSDFAMLHDGIELRFYFLTMPD